MIKELTFENSTDQSQTDYYKSLGYLMDGEKAEKQDDYLARMSGIIRLFATICLTQPPPRGLFGDQSTDDGRFMSDQSL